MRAVKGQRHFFQVIDVRSCASSDLVLQLVEQAQEEFATGRIDADVEQGDDLGFSRRCR